LTTVRKTKQTKQTKRTKHDSESMLFNILVSFCHGNTVLHRLKQNMCWLIVQLPYLHNTTCFHQISTTI